MPLLNLNNSGQTLQPGSHLNTLAQTLIPSSHRAQAAGRRRGRQAGRRSRQAGEAGRQAGEAGRQARQAGRQARQLPGLPAWINTDLDQYEPALHMRAPTQNPNQPTPHLLRMPIHLLNYRDACNPAAMRSIP